MTTQQPTLDVTSFSDLTKSQEEGIRVDIMLPSGEPSGAWITIAGPDSKRRQSIQRQIANSRLQRRKMKMNAADLEEEGRRITAHCVISWGGFTENGAEIPLSVDTAVDLFKKLPWVMEQVDDVAGDRAAFLTKPKKD